MKIDELIEEIGEEETIILTDNMREVIRLIVQLGGIKNQVDEQLIGDQNLIAAKDALLDVGYLIITDEGYSLTEVGEEEAFNNNIIDEFGDVVHDEVEEE